MHVLSQYDKNFMIQDGLRTGKTLKHVKLCTGVIIEQLMPIFFRKLKLKLATSLILISPLAEMNAELDSKQ